MAERNRTTAGSTHLKLWQQGDVLLHTAPIPIEAKLAGHGILARGEATGHAHRLVEATDGLLYESPDGTLYLRVGDQGATVTHEEHRSLLLPAGEYQIHRVLEYDHFAEEVRKIRD